MSPRRAMPQKKQQGGLPSWVILAAVIVVAVVAVIVAADFLTKAQPQAALPPTSGITATGRTKGDRNAKIAFVEFSDFQ
ncbi:MAG: hypothetical protein HY782_18625 [Chloroflexi bacterium]|nr:hypothetical protein [Chloroflexota bacterium]